MLISNTKVNYLITWEPLQAYRAQKKNHLLKSVVCKKIHTAPV